MVMDLVDTPDELDKDVHLTVPELLLGDQAEVILVDPDGKAQPVTVKPVYRSRSGFEIVPVLRGVTEISELIHITDKMDRLGLHAFICGGYARYCASPRPNPVPAGDVDVYCQDMETFKAMEQELKTRGLDVYRENDVAIAFKRPKTGPFMAHPPIQLIKPMLEGKIVSMGDVETILSNFDFTVIRGTIVNEKRVLVDADFMHDEEHMLIRIKNIHCPVSSMLRCIKYTLKGYWLKPLESLKLFLDWDERSPEYRIKLAEYLHKASSQALTKEEIEELEALMRID